MSLTYAKLKKVAQSLHEKGYESELVNFATQPAKDDLIHYLEIHGVLDSIYFILDELERQAQEQGEICY